MEPTSNIRDLDAEKVGTLAHAADIVQRTKDSVLSQCGELLRDDQRDTIEKRFSLERCVAHSGEYHLREPLEEKTRRQRRAILNYHNIDGMDVYLNESESRDTFEYRVVAETLRALSFQRPMLSPDLHQVYLRSGLRMMTLERLGDPATLLNVTGLMMMALALARVLQICMPCVKQEGKVMVKTSCRFRNILGGPFCLSR